MARVIRRAALVLAAVAAMFAIPTVAEATQPVAHAVAQPAGRPVAHPLGNFTINHYNGLQFQTDRIRDAVVIDTAEIPTVQERDLVDTDGDRETDPDELSAFAARRCVEVAQQMVLRVDGSQVSWAVERSSFAYRPGAAGLDVSRLECSLAAKADLGEPASVSFEDRYLADRLGWREITATGDGINLGQRDIAATSVSDELRSYPNDLLTSPLDQRSVELQTRPGVDAGAGALPVSPEAGPVASLVAGMTARLDSMVGSRELTLPIGILAVLLSLVLGVSHAALPGHGKTLMAAYMVGTRGTPKDAVLIAATVTVTHTAGVLILGLLFSASASFAGETVLAVLGVISGLLVAGIGVVLVRGSLRRRRQTHVDELWGHGHGHGHGHGDGHGHGHDPDSSTGGPPPAEPSAPEGAARSATALVDLGHGHGHGHDGEQEHGHEGEHEHGHEHGHDGEHEHGHEHGHDGEHEEHGHDHEPLRSPAPDQERGFRRLTLVGMGLAGGLVPSPSALIVLLGAIALGRTVFGVALVIGYGIGMAGTLTAVGYLVAKLPGKLHRVRALTRHRWVARLAVAGPVVTAALVFVVGIGLALRSAAPLV